jgi:glycosyltransferase involved in cell wall biosynthesis
MIDGSIQSRISVCFVCPKAYPLLNPACQATFGGAEVDLYLLGTELAKDSEFRVSFVTADYGQPQQEIRENVTLFKSLTFHENSLLGAWKIWRAMKNANADIYVQEASSLGSFLVSLFCRIHRKKFVYRTAHSDECDGTYIKRNLLAGKLFLWAMRKADRLVTQNHSDKAGLKENFSVEAEIIPNTIRCNNNLSGIRKHILWIARSAGFKHPERLLALAPQFPAETFVMICPKATEDNQYEHLQQKASAIANIHFIPKVNYNEVDKYYSGAKIYVNTSDSEGFPNAFVQAAAAGTAILSYAVNPDEFLTRFTCGLACGADMEKLKTGLAFLLENNRYIEIGQNGRKYAEQTHDITRIIEQYKTIFRDLVGKETKKPDTQT